MKKLRSAYANCLRVLVRVFVMSLVTAAGPLWAGSAVSVQHLNFDPGSRQAQLAEQTVRSELARLHWDATPWRWVIVHNPGDWQRILWLFPEAKSKTAFTLLVARTTYVNGRIFQESPTWYRRYIDHEIAHQVYKANQRRESEMQVIGLRWADSYPRVIDVNRYVPGVEAP